MAEIRWVRYSKSVWYPPRGQDVPRTEHSWRCKLSWNKQECPQAWEVAPFQGVIYTAPGHIHWARINKGEFIVEDNDELWTLLPEDIDVDECLVHMKAHYANDIEGHDFFLDEEPRDMWDADIFELQLQWDYQGAYLNLNSDIEMIVEWHVLKNGMWEKQTIFESSGGIHKVRVCPPIGDVVYLLAHGAGNTYQHICHMDVVGLPGIACGRYLHHRGKLYSPKDARNLLWVSAIVPVFHPSDLERFPRNSRAHQVQWWLEEAQWTTEAIFYIREHFPQSEIVLLRSLEEVLKAQEQALLPDGCEEVIVLKPYELETGLNPNKSYALNLFADAADEEYSRQSAWVMEKIKDARYKHLKFVERAWLGATIGTSNASGLPQYGFGYGFTRSLEHDTLWPMAARNIYLREQKESTLCHSCPVKGQCRQLLPSGYWVQSNTMLQLPWTPLDKEGCPAKRFLGS